MPGNPLTDFYESLRTEPDLQRLIEDRVGEDLHFEMKRKQNAASADVGAREREHFSKALSGFANSDGGVLLWGVGTNEREEAAELHPIADPSAFQRALKSSLLNSVQPFVDDVRIDVVPSDSKPGSGYVRCLIPRSEKTPHRALLAHREYFKRSTEGFVRLEHWDLEDMFGRRPTPKIIMGFVLVPNGYIGTGGETTYRGIVVPTVTNVGRGSAHAVYVSLAIKDQIYTFASGGIRGLNSPVHQGYERTITTDPQRSIFHSGSLVLHPDLMHEITGIGVSAVAGGAGNIIVRPALVVSYELSAENARLSRGVLEVSGEDIARGVLPEHLHAKIPPRAR